MNELFGRLLRILGARAFASFGVVTFLVGALLSTVNVTSRYAVKSYVDGQLQRIHWDVAIYQTDGYAGSGELPRLMRSVEGVERVESLAFLRSNPPEGQMGFEVDGAALATPWISVLAATTPSLLPPALLAALDASNENGGGAALALVGPERAMGKAFLSLQGSRQIGFRINLGPPSGAYASTAGPAGALGEHGAPSRTAAGHAVTAFTLPVRGVVRMERDDLNRWLMDQVGSISFVPHIGVTLLMPWQDDVLRKFESVSSGLITQEVAGEHATMGHHISVGQYLPEVVHLGRLDRARLISGWDIDGSLRNVGEVRDSLARAAVSAQARAWVDSTTLVLLERMNAIARLIGLLSLLIALPLLWMAWVLAGSLSGLLMLNERRTLGLMRLRGVPGRELGRALLAAITAGGLLGGLLGIVLGAALSLLFYEGGRLPLGVLLERRQLLLFALYLAVTMTIALVVSRRLVRYATTISPLEASGRVAVSEVGRAGARFRMPQLLCLLLGGWTLYAWISEATLSAQLPLAIVRLLERALNFVGLPLFLYGMASLLASRHGLIQTLLQPIVEPIGGRLGPFALKHVAVKPHRSVSFLLIVALMASVSLYPSVTSRSFEDKAARGARVQTGADLQLIFNAPEMADAEALKGPLQRQLEVLRPQVERIVAALEGVRGVAAVTYMLEGVLPNFYLPGHGLRGVPVYLLADVDTYLRTAYAEPELGVTGRYGDVVSKLGAGELLVSPPVADFWRIGPGTPVMAGMDAERRIVSAPASGVVAFLSGMAPLTVSDRQGYVQARLDYLNHLFANNAYVAAGAANPALAQLQTLIPRVVVLVKALPGARPAELQDAASRALPFRPLEVNTIGREIQKVGSDMFIALALQNMRIFLLGGLLLALVAILAVALANYAEDRRTIALLRIRGGSPRDVFRFFLATLLSPALLGLLLGGAVALLGGFGLANHVWRLRELKSVVHLLPTRLVVSAWTGALALLLLFLVVAVAWLFSAWVFRRTARQGILEG
jgi:ABC-type lipoprotein release transport system permease subunit